MDTELQVVARPVDGRGVVEALPVAVPQTTVSPAPLPEGLTEHLPKPAQPIAPVDKTSYQDFKAGDTDPLADVVIKEVLIKADAYIVYIDQDLILHWHWNAAMDSNQAVPIFNRAGELLAKSEFLRQTSRKRDLISARRLIGEGLVVMFCTQNQTYANAALDTAEKFITQIGRETSRVWYFGPFFIFFVVSVLSGMLLYRHGSMRTLTLPILCSLGGGIGAFISTAIGNERIPCAPSAGRFLHLLEALLRYAIGFSAGLLVWLATSGNIAVGFLNLANNPANPAANPLPGGNPSASIYALITVAIMAGASERLLPSLIGKFDDATKAVETPQTTKAEAAGPKPAGRVGTAN